MLKSKHKILLHELFCPGAIRIIQKLVSPVYRPPLVYAPNGWQTELKDKKSHGWSNSNLVKKSFEKYEQIAELYFDNGTLGFSYENDNLIEKNNISFHNIHLTFGYVLGFVSRMKSSVSILDWGAGIGHYYSLSKALFPDLQIDYYCVEVPLMVEMGKKINPKVNWCSDNSYLEQSFDLVMVNASLQYVKEWKKLLNELRQISKYIFLTRVPVINKANSFIAVQEEQGTQMLHNQFNKQELLDTFSRENLLIIREFVVGDKPYIKNAPEQCEFQGWLLKCS